MHSNITFHLLVSFILLSSMTSSKRTSRRNRTKSPYRDIGFEQPTNDEAGVCELEVKCRNGHGMPTKLPIHGPTGPPGRPGSPGLPGKPGLPGTLELARNQGEDACHVAFYVGLDANKGPVRQNTDLIFDKIITNVGDTFNTETGRFTAPYNGTYQFSVTVSAQGRQRAAVELVLNSKMVATVWAESLPFWASATSSAVLNLESGDQVWLVLLRRASYLHGFMYTSFSGHCLFRGL